MRGARWQGALFALGLCFVDRAAAQSSEDEWDDIMFMSVPPEVPAPIHEETGVDAKATRDSGRKKRGTAKKRRHTADGYSQMSALWHTVIEDGSFGSTTSAFPPLVFRNLGHGDPLVLTPDREDGGFDEGEVAFASQFMGSWQNGPSVHPHLLDLIYRATRHFDVQYVTVVSGVRRDRRGSRHSHGLAADIVLPGIDDDELAAYFRQQGFVGVGLYVRAGFVHIDVREKSYFWLDKSAPGSRRSRQTQMNADEAKAMDEAALARGETPHVNPEPLAKALRQRAKRRHGQRDKGQVAAKKERPKKRETAARAPSEAPAAAPKTATP